MAKTKKFNVLLLWTMSLVSSTDEIHFLTVTRKYVYHCVYIFHIILLEKKK